MGMRKGERAAEFMRTPHIMNHVGIKLNISKYF